ncbi:MAG: TlpA family protein disulfide reductase [Lentimicrobium sp.]|nr:TlpA family protein disulfide reductase [Lentimicrobium sp.]
MKKTILLLLLVTAQISLLHSQEVSVLDFQKFRPYLEKNNDTTYVINFWATWCLPCIKEIPYFQQVNDNYSDKKLKVLLVSLDFANQIDKRLKPFIEKHKLTPQVVLLNDPDANSWINEVSPEWSGALPATVIYNKNFRGFYEKSFTYNELEQIINQRISN